ncbi:ATP-grasp domain-containing protein [Leptospira sp. 96542]|nr:ATP-grasp domain-containing protein [Leptospira sp. 96542]
MKQIQIGVMGSGQLGQMMCQEALPSGLSVHCYSPEAGSPAQKAGAIEWVGSYEDKIQLTKFLSSIGVLSFEFENIPPKTLDFLETWEGKIQIHPKPSILKIAQDRFLEKSHFKKLGFLTAGFYHLTKNSKSNQIPFGFPWIIKTLKFGYDGKGQTKVSSEGELQVFLNSAFPTGNEEYLIEEVVKFDLEISVVGTRFTTGEFISFGSVENIHKNHILDTSIFPARIPEAVNQKAWDMAKHLAEDLRYVGTLGVEFFVKGEVLYLNEFAPRPHNSGHFSQDCESFSQFHLHLMAITGENAPNKLFPKPTVMRNILGHDFLERMLKFKDYLKNDRYRLHLYGKETAKTARKMGHINFKGNFSEIDTEILEI